MNGVTTVSFLKNLNSTLSKKNSITSSRVNGQLNNSVGMQTGKNLFTTRHQVAPQPSVDVVTPAKQEGGKWGTKDPGTGWSQKEKLDNPEEHKKVVKEGLKTVPAMIFAGAASTFAPAALPLIAKATAGAAGILGLKDLVKKPLTHFVNFFRGARKTLKK